MTRPVAPTRPTICDPATVSPSLTSMRERCASIENIPRPWSMITVLPVKYRSRAHTTRPALGDLIGVPLGLRKSVPPCGTARFSVENTPRAEGAIGFAWHGTNKRCGPQPCRGGPGVHLAEKGLVRSNPRQLGRRRIHERRVHPQRSRGKFSRRDNQRVRLPQHGRSDISLDLHEIPARPLIEIDADQGTPRTVFDLERGNHASKRVHAHVRRRAFRP